MNKIEKVLTVLLLSVLAVAYGFWYVKNSQNIKACMDNLPACEAAYYGN